jgi:hypothetical protein
MSTRIDLIALGKGVPANSWIAKISSPQQVSVPKSRPPPSTPILRFTPAQPAKQITPPQPATSMPPNRPSHSNFRPGNSVGAAIQQVYSVGARERGQAIHREVELFVKEKRPMCESTKAMIQPLIDYMYERGYVLVRAEQRVKSLDGQMSGKIDLVFLRDPLLPNIHEGKPGECDQGMQIFAELKTGCLWMFDAKRAKTPQQRENIMETRKAHIRQVCCYMRMYYERTSKAMDSQHELYSQAQNDYYFVPGGCIYYADLHKVIMVPKSYIRKFGF